MSRILTTLLGAAAVSIAFCAPAISQTFVTGNPSERLVTIPLSAAMAGTKVVVTVVGKRADDNNLALGIEGPTGLTLKVKSMTVNKAAAAQSTYKKYGIPTKLYGLSNAFMSSGSARQSATEGGDPNCGCLSEQEINDILSLFRGLYTRENFCRNYSPRTTCSGNGNSSGGGSTDSAYAYAFIESNRCLAGGKPAVAIELDLSGVAAADLQGEIKIKTRLSMYSGNRRAAIKPRSDGGIFPGQALLLAGPVGGEDAGVDLAKFSGARRTSNQTLAVPSQGGAIYYRGNTYLRRPISKYLSGGKGVFQITGGGRGYAICVTLARKRQNLNGYTN